MKYFVIVLIFSVIVILPAYAQYVGNQTTSLISIDANNKQYDITYRTGELQKITAVKYDAEAQSMLFYISSDDEFIIPMELQVSSQTFSDLLARSPECAPEETFLLANGMELHYQILKGDSIIWKFDVPPKTTVIELIGSSQTGQGHFPQIKGIERTYKIDAGQQIILAGNFVDSCGAPIKNGTITLSTTGLPMPRAEQTMSDDEGYFEFKILSHDLEGINVVKGTLYGETEYSITPYYDIDFFLPIGTLKQQIENSILPENLVCREGLVLVFKYNYSPACVKPATKTKLIERGWGTITYLDKTMEVQETDHSVKYSIDGNATVTDSVYSQDRQSVIITLDAITSGSLTIELPRTLIDSENRNCDPYYGREEPFAVLIDREEVLFEEIATTSEKRTLSISFPENSKKIEIVSFCFI